MPQQAITDGRVRGSNRLAYSTVPQSELSLEREGERDTALEKRGWFIDQEIESKRNQQRRHKESGAKNKQGQRESRETEEIDGRRNIHEGTHKRRQTETLQLQDHVFVETTRNRKGWFGWKGSVGQNRETSMCVCRSVCVISLWTTTTLH